MSKARKVTIGKLVVEDITSRMSKRCDKCNKEMWEHRLKITTGSGRWQKTTILCSKCGAKELDVIATNVQALKRYL